MAVTDLEKDEIIKQPRPRRSGMKAILGTCFKDNGKLQELLNKSEEKKTNFCETYLLITQGILMRDMIWDA